MTLSNRDPHGRGVGPPGHGTTAKPAPKCTATTTKPRPLHKVSAEYPKAARAARIEGRIILRATVGRSGTVLDVKVLQALDEAVDAAAVAAFRAWTFEPATACGKPVIGYFTIARDFALGH